MFVCMCVSVCVTCFPLQWQWWKLHLTLYSYLSLLSFRALSDCSTCSMTVNLTRAMLCSPHILLSFALLKPRFRNHSSHLCRLWFVFLCEFAGWPTAFVGCSRWSCIYDCVITGYAGRMGWAGIHVYYTGVGKNRRVRVCVCLCIFVCILVWLSVCMYAFEREKENKRESIRERIFCCDIILVWCWTSLCVCIGLGNILQTLLWHLFISL